MNPKISDFFKPFSQDISGIELPVEFNYPFFYQPHQLALLAAEELQAHLEETDFDHNFGLDSALEGTAIGKMFGVLVVRTTEGKLGYISAFSGKVGNSNHHLGFVPPVFDMLEEGSFFKVGEVELGTYTTEIDAIENNTQFHLLQEKWKQLLEHESQILEGQKEVIKSNRAIRLERRRKLEAELGETELKAAIEELGNESIADKLLLKQMQRSFGYQRAELEAELNPFTSRLAELKEIRAALSAKLQLQLIDNYTFLNAEHHRKSLNEIFTGNPLGIPAGSGECAAPKLLQFAYLNELEPIALSEFWWGESPKSDIRVHKQYYPACRGKCEPILGHMLVGLNVEENPLLKNPAEEKELPILFEDDVIIVVNKPAEFLSVPGKNITDSVYTRIKEMRPDAEGALIVHRLDMSTSGCIVLAKNPKAYKTLQRQFIKRLVKKRYVALLDGLVKEDEGLIELPLRVDLENRPRQLVCYEHGSLAKTHFKVLERKDGRTLVHFYPITGRTHQLRVHAAHQLGLGTPILGDDLYGTPLDRLYLHAEFLEFMHPVSKRMVKFKAPVPF